MKRYVLKVFFITLSPCLAFAGSSSRDCQTADTSIVMGAGNSSNEIEIKISVKGTSSIYNVPVSIMPGFDYNTEQTDRTILAIPISKEKVLSRSHKRMHVVHKNGSSCEGRESWDDHSIQTYALTGPSGKALDFGFALDPNVEALRHLTSMTKDGYVVAQFRCHTYGITTPGGCFAEDDGDSITWINTND